MEKKDGNDEGIFVVIQKADGKKEEVDIRDIVIGGDDENGNV